jgi:hypothetical protein
MISRREKLQLFNKLRGVGHAEADLALLEDVNPRHPKLTRFARDPKRYADEILYALLDECDEGDIVDHRIYFEKLNDTSTEEGQGPADGSSNTSAEEEQIPDDGSSNTSAEEEQIPDDGSSNTSTEEETSEGESQQESEQPDSADPGEDSKKK